MALRVMNMQLKTLLMCLNQNNSKLETSFIKFLKNLCSSFPKLMTLQAITIQLRALFLQ